MSTKRTEEETIKAAHALNLWTVSISQIIDYDDINVLEQEYDTIMNNLNLENMPKDEALLDVIKEIMDEVTNLRIDEGDKKLMEREYQHQLKNAVWSAVPNVTAIFASSDPMSLDLRDHNGISSITGCSILTRSRSSCLKQLGDWRMNMNSQMSIA